MSLKIKFDFIPFPLAIVDQAADLSLGEYRLLGYLLRHRYRVKSEKIRMTQDELLKGAFKPDGSRRDKGCGITSPRDLKTARESLVGRGWLLVDDRSDGMIYEVHIAGEDDEETESAKCTDEPPPSKSANCSVPECNLSDMPVQNALNDNKELRRLKKAKNLLAATQLEIEPKVYTLHYRCRKVYERYWNSKNTIPMPWGKDAAGALDILLTNNPRLTEEDFLVCLKHRHGSDVNHSERPVTAIPRLTDFSGGPLNTYNKPKSINGTSRKIAEKEQDIHDTVNSSAIAREWILGQGNEIRTAGSVSGQVRPLLESSTDNPGTDQGLVRRD